MKISTHPLTNVILHARSVISADDGSVGLFPATVSPKMTGMEFMENVTGLFGSGHNLCQVLRLVFFTPTNVV